MPREVTTSHTWLQLPDETVARYNALDVLATVRAHKALLRHLARNEQLSFYQREVESLVPAVFTMQRRGLPYDTLAKGLYRRKLRKELGEWDERLRSLYHDTVKESAYWPDIERARELRPHFVLEEGDQPPTDKKPMNKVAWKLLAKRIPEPLRDTTKGTPLLSFNLASDYHLRDWLFNVLKFKRTTSTESGRPSVDQDALNRILQKLRARRRRPEGFDELGPDDQWALLPTDEKVLCGLMHRARLEKIDNDYLDPEVRSHSDAGRHQREGFQAADTVGGGHGRNGEAVGRPVRTRNQTGRVYPVIKLTGTESGRFAYAEPPIHSWPDEIRHLIAATGNDSILGADIRALEARVFAHLIQDDEMIEMFERNAADPSNPEFDLHIRNACDLFNWTLDDFLAQSPKKRKAARVTAKTFQFGVIQYGGEPTTAKTKVSCPCPWCADKSPPSIKLTPSEKKLQAQRWFSRHPKATMWRNDVSRTLATRKALVNALGRKRYFTEPYKRGAHIEREAWAWMVSSTGVDIFHRALRDLHAKGVPLILEQHDALYAETDAPSFHGAMMRASIEKPVAELGGAVFPADVHSGANWEEASG